MKAQIVSFHCVLKDRIGRVISATHNRDIITASDGHGDTLKALVDGLQNLKTGDRREIFIPAEEAYGFYDPELVIEVMKENIECGNALEVGQEIRVESENGGNKSFRVTQIKEGCITLDGNHPLAGQDLFFNIEATDARDATPDEIRESSGDTPGPGRLLH